MALSLISGGTEASRRSTSGYADDGRWKHLFGGQMPAVNRNQYFKLRHDQGVGPADIGHDRPKVSWHTGMAPRYSAAIAWGGGQ